MTERRATWLEVQIETDPAAAEIMAAVVSEITEGVELRDAGTVIKAAPQRALVIAHIPPENREQLVRIVDEAAQNARSAGVAVDPLVIRERAAHEDEWRDVWKQFFRATRVGRTFIVRPSWDAGDIAAGDRVIDLDPGRAFGTGGHASTRLVIALAEELDNAFVTEQHRVRRFLDLGCGSGILSIAAARLWPNATGLAVDIDADSTACAQENFDRNRVETVALETGTLEGVPVGERFDVVMANIQADVLCGLAPQLPAHVADGGRVLLSGLLLRDAEPVVQAFGAVGFELVRRQDEGEWAALDLRLANATNPLA